MRECISADERRPLETAHRAWIERTLLFRVDRITLLLRAILATACLTTEMVTSR